MSIREFQLKFASFVSDRKEQRRFIRFAVVGAIGFVVHVAVLNTLVFLMGQINGVGPEYAALYANPVAFSAAVISNFLWNRFWSFPESRQRPLLPQFGQFALINVIGFGINQTILLALLRYLLPMMKVARTLGINLALICAIAIVMFWNFGVNRLTTYRGL